MAKSKSTLPPAVSATNGHTNRIVGPPAPPEKPKTAKGAGDGGRGVQIIIPQAREEILPLLIRGTKPLVVHHMDKKAVIEMASRWFNIPKVGREKKDPEAQYQASKYVSTEGWEGMHAGAFRAACVGATRMVDKLPMTLVKRLIFIEPDGESVPLEVDLADGQVLRFEPKPLVKIIGEARMRTDMITVDGGSPDVRFRASYWPWSIELRIRYNAMMISASQVANLVRLAGVHEGVGDIRPSAKKNDTADLGTWEIVEGGR